MKHFFLFLSLLVFNDAVTAQDRHRATNGLLKYVIYDFDGLYTGQTNLPDGDYRNNDLTISVQPNPLSASEVIGDRCLKLNLNWQIGSGDFGKATMRFLELNASSDKLNFYIYNPESNSGSASVQMIITEDDNGNNSYEDASDDKWIHQMTVQKSGAWQLISVPLSAFQDGNAGGNGAFDAAYTGAGGMLLSVGLNFSKPGSGSVADVYYIDMFCFSDGDLPVGNTVLELPPSTGGGCALGALTANTDPALTPGEVHAYLPQGKKITYVNWFMYYSNTGTTADMYPGTEVQTLLDNGYQPIITWESMYSQYTRLDPVQPRLDKINNGSLDGYIDAFANKVKTYNGTIILRILHEFEGDWYSWSLTQNNNSASAYVSAFRHIVDRFRAAGANNVKWMWCLNAEPKPYARHNWVVDAYPGDSYVDIVATDIYNHPDLGTPDWKSFRYTMSESYYYLVKYYGHKPLFVCEVGSRERNSGDAPGGQTKADWLCCMNRDLKSYFPKVEALVFFSMQKEHDWRINSSDAAKQAFIDCFWNDAHYGQPMGVSKENGEISINAYPNPFFNEIRLLVAGVPDTGKDQQLLIYDLAGKIIFTASGKTLPVSINPGPDLPSGMYIVEVTNGSFVQRQKLVKLTSK